MVKVGVIGIGTMGNTHLDAYAKRSDVEVVAISDKNPQRLAGKEKAVGNVEGQAKGSFDLSRVKKYDEGMKLIADPEIELVDICLTTPMHAEYAKAALAAGKHVLVEKPLCRTSAEAFELAQVAESAKGLAMPAMCMRFWPGWTWLKRAIDARTYGPVRSAHFRRIASHPGGPFYSDGSLCGGAALDLHIHDTDFIQYCFGMPKAVSSTGYSKITNDVDHLVTRYDYDGIPLVVAEGGWAMAPGFGFQMQYMINFENATATFNIGAEKPLMLCEAGKEPQAVELEAGMGYDHEIAYFLDCIQHGRAPKTVTLQDGANAVKIIEAEVQSVKTGQPVPLAV